MVLKFDRKKQTIIATERTKDKILNPGKISLSYTLQSDDITLGEKVKSTPYVSRTGTFIEADGVLMHKETETTMSVEEYAEGLKFSLHCDANDISEWGVNLPFNFMGKLNGGGWKNQYLFNSPYASSDNKYIYCYLSNPQNHNILVLADGELDGWKMDYSPYVGGHFFCNLKLLAQFDKVYKPLAGRKTLSFYVFAVEDFNCAVEKISNVLQVPVMKYEMSGGKIGDEIEFSIFGAATHVCVDGKEYPVSDGKFVYTIAREGRTILTPYSGEKKGLDCVVYGYSSLSELYKKSMDTFSWGDIDATDGNLCEHQCWAPAMLRYMLKYGKVERYENEVKKLLSIVTETDEEKAKSRITILSKGQKNGLPPYHIFNSTRIQEQFFGVTLLLDAYRYFGDDKWGSYAVNALNTLLDTYQKEDGRLETWVEWNARFVDYSTVCCLMIPIVDMANYFADKKESIAQRYKKSAAKLAEYLYNRGICFPTETDDTVEAEEEMEDGSISCTALALLYYCVKIERKEEYIQKAREILALHESWMMNTPIACMHRSSLRWWETQWEGDQDGPALCCGHAWTIWRAEADYWMYRLTGEQAYFEKAKAGFLSNFAKIDGEGKSYSIYQADYITGGGFFKKKDIRYALATKFPKQTDSGLTRYAWLRASESIFMDWTD